MPLVTPVAGVELARGCAVVDTGAFRPCNLERFVKF